MATKSKTDIELAKAVRLVKFYDDYMTMPDIPMRLNEKEYDVAKKIVYSYLSLVEQDKLYKSCNCCGEIKPLSDFGLTHETRIKGNCKPCIAEYYQKYAKENSGRLLENKIRRDYTQPTAKK